MLSNIYGGMNMLQMQSLLTSDDNCCCEAVARKISQKDYTFLNLMC